MSFHDRRGREISHAAQGAFVILAIFFAAFMFAIGVYVGQNSEPAKEPEPAAAATAGGEAMTESEPTETEATETGAAGTEGSAGGGEDGKAVFASAGCGSCHTLDEAGSGGSIGPNLDDTSLDREAIEERVRNGQGAMPPFEGSLEDAQIEAVADFVDASKG